MKKEYLLIALLLLSGIVNAQFKEKGISHTSIRDGIINTNPNFILGIIDPAKFSMSHSYSLSYTAFGGNSFALGVYTNSMMYRFTDNLNVEVDANVVHSPFSSFGKSFQNEVNGVYLSRAQVNYKPWENFSVTLLYQKTPVSYYYSNPFRNNPFWYSADQP